MVEKLLKVFWKFVELEMMRVRTALTLMILALAQGAALAEDIVAGPMIGNVTGKSARIWMQLSIAKQVTIECYDERGSPISAVSLDVEGPLPFVCDLPVNNLQPNQTYRIVVKLNGDVVQPPGPDVVIRTAPSPGEQATFTVGIGSGVSPTSSDAKPVFNAINDAKPRTFLFLGNSGMLPAKLDDFPTTRRATFRAMCESNFKIRTMPELQTLFRTTACYGIWGERDFGAIGADKTWVFAKESQAALQRYWANPDWGTPENPGCYCTFTMGDVDFFLLDDRMFRDAETDPARKTMLGDAQLTWLKKGLLESTATFKVIGCASDLLADYSANSWRRYAPEQQEFTQWIFANHISGALFVSGGGGRSFGELTAIGATKGDLTTYPLVELTSATLGSIATPGVSGTGVPANPDRSGNAVTDRNFGTLDFGGPREHRFVTLRLRDATGKIRVEQTVYASQLHSQ
jgi:alkaline phosphatase D